MPQPIHLIFLLGLALFSFSQPVVTFGQVIFTVRKPPPQIQGHFSVSPTVSHSAKSFAHFHKRSGAVSQSNLITKPSGRPKEGFSSFSIVEYRFLNRIWPSEKLILAPKRGYAYGYFGTPHRIKRGTSSGYYGDRIDWSWQ